MRGVARFIHHEASSGVFLICAAAAAVILENSPLSSWYGALLTTPVTVQIGSALDLQKPLLLWINDGLMAIFFLLVGLEIKREVLEGELSSRDQILLPAAAAVGGMALPAAIYAFVNWGDPVAIAGWAIPAATDIAFALGVLALLGPRVPAALKVFLLTLAILDDLGAIAIIALFYTEGLSMTALLGAGVALVALVAMNRAGTPRVAPYVMVGVLLWIFVLKSGVHATLAGVALGFAIPMRRNDGTSPLKSMEHGLHPYVAFFIMPVFAFANAGVSLSGFTPASLLQPVSLGIALGLFVGKQVGVFGLVWLMVRTGLARLPAGTNLGQIHGAACLAGIGFTMSLFIGSLSFADPEGQAHVRIGVIAGSLASALIGYVALRLALRDNGENTKAEAAA